ncbi:MAG TPA: condensation domain-containing protein, partial [Anaerolineales bacterium]|nr:condensation domain-containing protein [Anaerolineales bacterium]
TLHQYSGETDLVFGVVVSGRSAPLAGVESRAGLYINTLPLRIRMDSGQSALEWIRAILKQQIALEQYAHTPPGVPGRCAGIPAGQPLFNSAIRFQNYPSVDAGASIENGVGMRNLTGVDWWHYPLNVVVVPDSRVKLTIRYDARFFEADGVRRILQAMTSCLSRLPNLSEETELQALLSG